MLQLLELIPLIAVLPLLVFWMWMFRDMTNNNHLQTASKSDWTQAFLLLNIFAAINYYGKEYKSRH